MQKTTRIAIAGLLNAAGAVLTAFAVELGGADNAAAPEAPAAPETAPPKAPKRKAAAAAEPEKPAEPEPGDDEPKGKTYEELKALIEPLVKGGQGPDVKKLIAKYDPDGQPPSIKTMPAKNHAAFEKDLATLSY